MEDNANNTNNVNTAGNVNTISSTVNAASTNKVNVVGEKISIELPFDQKMSALEDNIIFDISGDDEDDGAVAEMNNLDTTIQELCIAFERLMHEKFQMSSMGELTFFLGLQVNEKKDGMFISQDKYVAKILKKFRFTEVKTASTSMETQKPLLKDEDGKEVDVHMYRSMIGSLMYLTSSRPDIMFAVCAYARYQVNPKVSHLHAVKRIFRYLKGQPKGIWYLKDSPFDLIAYTNSDYDGASLDRKSTRRGCQFFRCRLISWQCKKQIVVANSITEAEYVVASSCCGQVLWIQNQLLDYGKPKRKDTQVPQSSDPIKDVPDEVVHKELGNSLVRVATTASSLHAECQETMRGTTAQTRLESVSKHSNDSLLARDEEFTLVSNDSDKELFDVDVLDGEEVFVAEHEVATKRVNDEVNVVEEVVEVINTAKLIIDAAQDCAAALKEIKSIKPKEKGIVIQELGKSTTIKSLQKSQHKGKGILTKPVIEPIKRKYQIRLDEEAELKLQAAFDEKERHAREKARKVEEFNIALTETWDDIQAKIDVDHQLAKECKHKNKKSYLLQKKLHYFNNS
nr:uncharacterized mitochondrial protein AtMg00810-like [Tanacetum cinerariifolium]